MSRSSWSRRFYALALLIAGGVLVVRASAGDTEAALMHVKIAMAMRPNDANVLYNAACTYGLMGMKIDALDTFRRAVNAGYSNLDWCLRDPDLQILYEEPEFKALVQKYARPTS